MLPRYKKSTVVAEELKAERPLYKARNEDTILLQAQNAPGLLQPRPSIDKAVLAAYQSAQKFKAIQDQRLVTLRQRDKLAYDMEMDKLQQEARKSMPFMREFQATRDKLDSLIDVLTEGLPSRPPTSYLRPEDIALPASSSEEIEEEGPVPDLSNPQVKSVWDSVKNLTMEQSTARYGRARPIPYQMANQPPWWTQGRSGRNRADPRAYANMIRKSQRAGRSNPGDDQWLADYDILKGGTGSGARGSTG